jgi:hypothetical protein
MTFPSEECVIIMTKGENSHLLMAAVAGALGRRKDYQSLDPPGAGRLSISCFINSFARVKILMPKGEAHRKDVPPAIIGVSILSYKFEGDNSFFAPFFQFY